MKIGITRSAEELGKLLDESTARGFEIVPLPLINYKPIEYHLPKEMNIQTGDWLIFTSRRGVEYFIGENSKNAAFREKNSKIAAVGQSTAEAMRQYGFEVSFIPSRATGQILFNEFIARYRGFRGRIIYPSADNISFDPEKLFTFAKMNYYRLVVYTSEPVALSFNLISQFHNNDDAILFTSPLAVRIFAQEYGAPKTRAIAIGEVTENTMIENGWKVYSVLSEPNIQRAVAEVGAVT